MAQFYFSLPDILAGTDFQAVSVGSYLPLEEAAGTNQVLKKWKVSALWLLEKL